MPRRSVVIGLPLTLALRGLNMLGGRASSIVSKIAPAVSVLSVATPWLSEIAKTASSSSTAGVVAEENPIIMGLSNILGAAVFADMNAQMVDISEKRRMAIVDIPGRESDFLQDLGGHSAVIKISGKFFDEDPSYNQNASVIQQFLQSTIRNGATGSTQILRLLMRTATPVPFMCEHDIAMGVITDFKTSMVAGEPRMVNYDMTLVEYTRIPYIVKMGMLGISNQAAALTN